jgi:hypothetical protein
MEEKARKDKDFKRKAEMLTFLMRILRIKDLSAEEIKVINLIYALSNESNCARISFENLRAAGLHSTGVKEQILSDLREKNIILPLTKNTKNTIKEKICSNCLLRYGSKECNKRYPTFYINKNHKSWVLKKKPSFNDHLISELLKDNGIEMPVIEDIPLNKQIEFKKKLDFKTDAERNAYFFEEFDKERAKKSE